MKIFAVESELINNGDFEKGVPAGLVLNNASIVKEDGPAGSNALKIAGKKSSALIKGIKTSPGQRYKLSYIAKAGDKILTNTGFQYFRVFVSWEGADQKNGTEWQDTSTNYQNKELIFCAPRINFWKGMDITCELDDEGSLLLDNFKIEMLPPEKLSDAKITLNKPFYRNIIYDSDPVAEISGSILVDDKVTSAEVIFSGKNSSLAIFEKKYSNIKGSFNFSIPAENLKNGKFILSVTPYDKDRIALGKAQTHIWKLAESPVEIIYKNDLNCYINGKIFYPIVFLSCINIGISNDVLKLIFYNARKNGVNVFLLYPPFNSAKAKDLLRMLNAAKEFDCKIILALGNATPFDKESFKKWQHETLNKIRPEVLAHEALFGYLFTDEPMWKGVPLENLTASYDFIKGIDPYRPIWINEAPRGTVKDLSEYSAAADIWGVDIYPVPAPNSHSSLDDKGLTSAGKYTRLFRDSVNGRKPVWMILQGFSWHTLGGAAKKPKAYPDKSQTTFMAFDCLVNGAQTICYWGMNYIDEASFWNVLFDTTKKLSALSGVVTLPESGTVKCASPTIKFSAKEKDGKIYIIAVNESDKEADAGFDLPFRISSMRVVFENREILCSDGWFTDKFAPYASHVYASGELPEALIKQIPTNEEMDKKTSPFDEKYRCGRYSGKAQWIWFPGKNMEPLSMVAFCKEFNIGEIPAKAEILITADDNYVLYLNGRKIGKDSGDSWEIAEIYDIKPFLKKGTNTVYVEAADAGIAPCAFLAGISLLDSKGNKRNILSDSSWQVMEIKKFSGHADSPVKGRNAGKIADYGKGPWGSNLRFRAKQ